MQPTKITTKDLLNNFSNLAKTLKETVEAGEEVMLDLHIHTSESHENGCNYSPVETIERLQALAELLKTHIVFSITDHESIMGSKLAILEMQNHPEKYKNITCISGVEFNASLKNVEMDEKGEHSTFGKVHILGYGYNINDPELSACSILNHIKFKKDFSNNIKAQSNKYVNTGKQIIASIHQLEKVYKIKFKYSMFLGVAFKKTHEEMREEFINIAKLYLKEKKIKEQPSIEETLENIFKPDRKSFGEQAESLYKIDMFRIIELVKNAGGKVIIAHPNSIKYNKKHIFGKIQLEDLTKFVSIIQQKSHFGLDGLEIFHGSNFHGKAAKNLFEISKNEELFPNGCYITGGSDFHGELYKEKFLGNIFPNKFEKLLNETENVNQQEIPSRIIYLPIIDNVVFNKQVDKIEFIVENKTQGILSEELIVNTALMVGKREILEKQQGNTNGLEEQAIENIYKGKPKEKIKDEI